MNDKEVLAIIQKARSGLEYGTIQLTIKIHERLITAVDATKITNNATPKGNVEALTVAGSLIKGTSMAIKQSRPNVAPPVLTFSVFFGKDGEAHRVSVNDFERTNKEQ